MSLLFDTSILIALERENQAVITHLKNLTQIYPGVPRISFATCVEFLVGIEKAPPHKRPALKEFLWQFPVLQTTSETAFHFSRLKILYDAKGDNKSFIDLLIASHAIEYKLTLVTLDKDFESMQEIKKVCL